MHIERIESSKLAHTNYKDEAFGTCFTDHMFEIHFEDGKWSEPTIKPYGPFQVSPSTQAFHYGQVFFEGMKAYKNNEGEVMLFRPLENAKRFNKTAERLCMPSLPEAIFLEGLSTLLDLDKDWVPASKSASLYIRPFMFASGLGVKASESYRYTMMIICCPVETYYKKPVKLLAERQYVRAAIGGTGAVKAGGNYAGSFQPALLARQKGYDQIMWTDAETHNLVEEAGTMNIFFRIGNKLVTPALNGSILPGITRNSLIQIAKRKGIELEERQIPLTELEEAYKKGELIEAFGAGTAATISNISEINIDGNRLFISEDNSMSAGLKDELEGIKRGDVADEFNWMHQISLSTCLG
ncbi:MAG: branched-chain amino acid aminotransferase [Flavobacteriales bacterium]